MPLSHLADRVNQQRYELRRGPLGFSAPCFDWRGQQIWGATSMILAELIGVLEEHQPGWISSR
jgi:hypothetical protein